MGTCADKFHRIQDLFDNVSSEVESYSDLIAAPARGRGGTAHGTVQVAAERLFSRPLSALALRTGRNTCLPFRERPPHSPIRTGSIDQAAMFGGEVNR